jgi:hypothetical protein
MQGQSTVREPPARAAGLVDQLDGTRTGMRVFLQCRCLLRTVLVVLALGGLLAAADWLWVLPTMVRGAGLLVLGALAVVLLGRGLIGAARKFGRQDAAAEVEAAFPQLGQRVCTTVEYVDPDAKPMPAAPGLVVALAADTSKRTSVIDFGRLIPWRSLRGLAAALVGVAALAVVLLAISPEARIAAMRLFLLPVDYTQLDVKPGDHALKVGSDLTVQVTVTGRPVSEVNLLYRPAGSGEDWASLSFVPDDTEEGTHKLLGTLETTVSDCRDNLEYRVVAGPVASPVYHLTVFQPLVLKGIEAHIEPPAYTRRPAAVVKEGDFKVIAGSRVRLRLTLDRQPQTARLALSPTNASVALQIRGNELTGELPSVEKDLEYELVVQAADGMGLEEARRFRIQVQPDRKPTVRFVKPRDQIEVTPSTEVHMKVEAGDDFGLSAVGIVYQMGDGAKKTLYLKRDPAQPTALRTEAVLSLENEKLSFQDAVTYYAFAEDNHPGRPQRTATELQFIDIRPYKREYQLLKGGGS